MERLPISRRHPWIGTPPSQGQRARPVPCLLASPDGRHHRGGHQQRRPVRQPPTPAPARAFRLHQRAELPRRGRYLAPRPRNPDPTSFDPTARLLLWLTYERTIDVTLAGAERLLLDLTVEDRMSLTLTDSSHAG